jgi:ribosome biogenesis GTPase
LSLTRRQEWRIKKIQDERISRAKKSSQKADNLSGTSNNFRTGIVITRFGHHLLVEDDDHNLYKCTARSNLSSIVAGDQVLIELINLDEAVISALYDRENSLSRTNKLIASNLDEVWLVIASEPKYQIDLIDKYLIVVQNAGLKLNLIFNKVDLIKDKNIISNDLSAYRSLGIDVIFVSAYQNDLSDLKEKLSDKNNIFVGQSGVGKSSIINLLIPDINIRVNEISEKKKLGKHTTTNTTLYHIPSGGNLIDSPGVREFQLDQFSKEEILYGFVEFNEFSNSCKYRNCIHLNEPHCAVKDAVNSKKISKERYLSYQKLISEYS